ncbi:ATP-binding protein [Symbioplanes lichenis]|uniref:ATP-binding protein n=1 Tax=Symbioplanes lichenis TaxID=1629072 RepID=UPI0027390F42|nr:ATP-binding protein [Actinoplanes lichenis]
MTARDSHAQQPVRLDDPVVRERFVERVWALVGAYGPNVNHLLRAGPALMPGISGLGLSAGGPQHERPPIRYSSDTPSARLEALQYVLDEGPCRDVTARRTALLAPDLGAQPWHRRWPRFTEGALEAGARAVHALPLHAGGVHHAGALDLYRRAPGRWADDHQAEATAFAAAIAELLALEQHELDLTGVFGAARRPGAAVSDEPPPVPGGGPEGQALLIRWFGPAQLATLRRQVRAAGLGQGLTGADLHRFLLAVHAAATNAICHGGGLGQLLLWRARGTLWCEITDQGTGIPQDALAERRVPDPESDWSTGWGLSLIRRVCTSVALLTDGTGTRVQLGCRIPA